MSYDPRMPARLASFPCHMTCNFTPPYALLDPAALTATTALNLDGDGWSPRVDIVRLECPSPLLSTGMLPGGMYVAAQAAGYMLVTCSCPHLLAAMWRS